MNRKLLLGTIVCFLLQQHAWGQLNARYNSFSYNVNEGLLQSTISDVAFDNNNFCWVGVPNGIQKFDGRTFNNIALQAGLPDDKGVLFFKCSNGTLLISHSGGISKYSIDSNNFTLVYRHAAQQQSPTVFLGEDEGIIYIYDQAAKILGLDCRTFKILSSTTTGFPSFAKDFNYRPRVSKNIINHRLSILINKTLYLWDIRQKKILYVAPPHPTISAYTLMLKSAKEVLFATSDQGNALRVYNFETGKTTALLVKGKDNDPIARCVVHHWKDKWLISFNNRLFETDSSFQSLKAEIVNFQNKPVAGLQSISAISEDNFGNLYLQTVSGGLKKIIQNNYPFKYYSTSKEDSNFTTSIFPHKKANRVLAGTVNNGLLVYDTLQRLVKHIRTLPGQRIPAAITGIAATNKGDYLLYVSGEKDIWHLSHDLTRFTRWPVSSKLPNKMRISYFTQKLFQNNDWLIVQSQESIYRTHLSTRRTTHHYIRPNYIMSGIIAGRHIIIPANDELLYLDTGSLNIRKRVPFKNTGYVRCFTKAPSAGEAVPGTIYVGSNKGIFKIDSSGKVLQHITRDHGLPDECIYAMAFDEQGMLWCSTNKGLLRIGKNNSIHQFKKEDGLQENEFNTNAVAVAHDGEMFFAGVNGISSFYPQQITNYSEQVRLLLTRVRVNNEDAGTGEAAWSISKLSLPHHKNFLAFDFVAMGNNNPGQYIYQYKMEGVDDEWVLNEDAQTVRYNLQPGEYTFKMYAGRYFDKDALPMKQLFISIHPPFYRTWWFVAAMLVLIVGLLAFFINQFNKARYRRKVEGLNAAHRLQVERERISRDLHDSIGAYANAVLYSTQLLEEEKEEQSRLNLMMELKFASKDIITSLRETIWALKKDSYTTQDCILRIRNFVQPLSRHYPHIQFSIEGEGSSNHQLHYGTALHVVRIIQEAVTNAIKHSKTTAITITSSEEGKRWRLQVSDNGIGFTETDMQDSGNQYGLGNMKERAAEAGFALEISSAPGRGSSFVITV